MKNLVFGSELMFVICGVYFANAASPVFVKPPPGGGNGSIPEDKAVGSSILPLEASDADGQTLTFSIISQEPTSPTFNINDNDELTVPSGLDHEVTSSFTFTFRVSDGANTATTPYTLTITDVDDTAPVFNPSTYAQTITDTTPTGTSIVTITAKDVDSETFSFTIQGSQTTFAVSSPIINGDTRSANITVANQSELTALIGSPIELNIDASDGTNIATAKVKITVQASPCNSSPCKNGGSCTNTGTTNGYSCTCFTGYTGRHCESVDYCFTKPCKGDASCDSLPTDYKCTCPIDTCDCRGCYEPRNCTRTQEYTCGPFCEDPDKSVGCGFGIFGIVCGCGIVVGGLAYGLQRKIRKGKKSSVL